MTRLSIAGIGLVLALFCIGCGGDGEPTAAPTGTPGTPEEVSVVVSMTTGCDRPQPEQGTELLALVTVMLPDGRPVIAAQVEGSATGPDVLQATASDATFSNGEALLLFLVGELGSYTITVDGVTMPTGAAAILDPSSELEATYEVGEVCEAP